jgi:small-conductance mechanosensitive channel
VLTRARARALAVALIAGAGSGATVVPAQVLPRLPQVATPGAQAGLEPPRAAAVPRSATATRLAPLDRTALAGIAATRRTTESSLKEIALVIERMASQVDALSREADVPGSRERAAELAADVEIAREAEAQFRDAIRLADETLALEEEKRQANAERANRLEDEAAFEKSAAGPGQKSFTLEQSDAAKRQLAQALDHQRLVQARAATMAAELDGIGGRLAEADAQIARREGERAQTLERLLAERRRGAPPDQVELLSHLAERMELRRDRAREKRRLLGSREALLREKLAVLEFVQATARLDVALARCRSDFIAERAAVSPAEVESQGEKLLEKEHERDRRVARADADARKADSERTAALDRRAQAEEELARARREPDREAARAKIDLARLGVDEAETRKRIAEAQSSVAQAEFDRARELYGYYSTLQSIRTDGASEMERTERLTEVRGALKLVAGRLEAAARQAEEARAESRVLAGQAEALGPRVDPVDARGERALAQRVREQQRALTRLLERKEDLLAQLSVLSGVLVDMRRFLTDLNRRLERELGLSRLFERRASALSSDSLRDAAGDLAEIRARLGAAVRTALSGGVLAPAFLPVLAAVAFVAYLAVALVLFARRRLDAAEAAAAAASRGTGGAAVSALRVARRASGWAGVVVFAAAASPAVPEPVAGAGLVLAVTALAYATLAACLDELFAPAGPDRRLVTCSDDVSRHVSFNLKGILIATAVLVPLTHLLPFAYAALGRPPRPALVELVWVAYKLVAAFFVILLAWRKDLVLAVAGGAGTGPVAAAANRAANVLTPLVTLCVLALFALDSIGYVELAHFLTVATLESVVTVGLAVAAHRLLSSTLTALLVGDAVPEGGRRPPAGPPGPLPAAPDAGASPPAGEPVRTGESLVATATRLARWALGVATVVALYIVWGGDREGLQALHRILSTRLTVGPFDLSPISLVEAVVVMYLALLASRAIRRFLEVAVYPTTQFDSGVQYALSMALHYFVMAMGLSFSLECLGLGMEYVKWFVGAIGVGAGFGLQHIVFNIISGIIVLIERPVKIGDWIEVGGTYGRVEKIAIRSTTVCNQDNIEVIIPNAELVSQKVSNWTHTSPVTRVRLGVKVVYGTDPDVVRRLLMDVAAANPNVLAVPVPQVFFSQFGDSALEFELAVACKDPMIRPQTASELRFAVERAFRKARIAVPYMAGQVWAAGSSAPAPATTLELSPRAEAGAGAGGRREP